MCVQSIMRACVCKLVNEHIFAKVYICNGNEVMGSTRRQKSTPARAGSSIEC